MSLKIIHTKKLKWVDIVNIDDADLNYLKENFKFHPLDIEDVTTPSIRTKIDEYDEYNFVVMLFPYFHKERNEIRSLEVDFFIGPDYLVTVHSGQIKTLTNMVHSNHQFDHARSSYMTPGPGFLLFSILEVLFKRNAPLLDRINKHLTESERNVFQLDIETLKNLAELKKNIISYRRIVKMHRYVLGKLLNSERDYLKFKDSKTYFQDLIEYGENIWNLLSSDKESVESFEETNQSLGTHKINDILQILTVLSVIVAVLGLFTNVLVFFERGSIEGFFGLGSGVDLFLFLTTGLIVITALLFLFFRKKQWL